MNDYIYKPFRAEELFLKMHKLSRQSLPVTNGIMSGVNFDIGYVQRFAMDSKEFTLQLLDIFLTAAPELLRELAETQQTNDLARMGFVAHKNKSMFSVMGLSALQEQLEAIEGTARLGHHRDTLPERLQNFDEATREACRQITVERAKLVNA